MMLPNGAELAVAIVCVASNAACAVVNAVYAAEELERYFAALRPRALITPAGADGPARRVALARRHHDHRTARRPVGRLGCSRSAQTRAAQPSREPIGPGDTAICCSHPARRRGQRSCRLRTPTSAARLTVRLRHWRCTETDRCLNVLPLFHGHGLIATVLTSLAAGGECRLYAGL